MEFSLFIEIDYFAVGGNTYGCLDGLGFVFGIPTLALE